ncbi:MAG: hypothetical protein LBH00_01035, partial [Planctomycetaceae bacterium]|nr:hypothetical protein [Planctomycetaceae bacterium]
MKNMFCGFLLSLAIAFAGCEPSGGRSESVSINGTPAIGQTLTATSEGGDFTGNFVWAYADTETAAEADRTEITDNVDGADNSTLTLTAPDLEGKYIWPKRTDSSGNTVWSVPVQVTAASAPSVKIDGTPAIGQTLTATSEGGDFTGNFVWAYADTETAAEADRTEITDNVDGDANSTLTLTDTTLEGKYIWAKRTDSSGNTVWSVSVQVTAASAP